MTTRTIRRRSPSRPVTASDGRRLLGLGAALLTTALCPLPGLAQEMPTGGNVIAGGAEIAQPGAGQMRVTQTSPRAIIEWDGFSVGQGGRVDFAQPGQTSAVLNRVTGPLGSRIDGTVTGNGEVYLVNPRGVVVGPSGRVEAGSFVASTLDIDNGDFQAGRLRFSGNGASAAVANHGTIAVRQGGMAALLGGKVTNTGTITAPLGRVGLGAGERATLDLTGDRFLQIALPSDTEEEVLIEQAGRVSADGGRVEISAATAREAARRVVNLSGVTEARSVSGRSGAIVLGGGAGGTVRVTGRVDAGPAPSTVVVDASPRPAVRPQGGEILVTGERIELALGSEVRADGPGGGGRIRIGGDVQGQGPLPRAGSLSMDAGAVVSADATEDGEGGSIVLWADTEASVFGLLTARGGPAGGDGGFVEVSSPGTLRFDGAVDTTAPLGMAGTFLLDPTDVVVCDFSPGVCEPGDVSGVYTTEQIENLLGFTNVTVKTAGTGEVNTDPPFDLDAGTDPGDITVEGDIAWATGFDLTFDATRDIFVTSNIAMQGGGFPILRFNAGRDVSLAGEITSSGNGLVVADGERNVSLTGGITGPGANLFAGENLTVDGDITSATPTSFQSISLLSGFLSGTGTTQLNGDILAPAGELFVESAGGTTANGAVDVRRFDLEFGSWTQLGPSLPAFSADDFRLDSYDTAFLRATGGTGGPGDPYVVVDVFGLQGAGWGDLSTASFALGNDIDASGTAGWYDTETGILGWRPIGAIGSTEDFSSEVLPYFSGTLDGNGFAVTGLTIREPGFDASDFSFDALVGMYGGLDGARISDLMLQDIDFSTDPVDYAGGLAGRAVGESVITGVDVTGTLTIDGTGVASVSPSAVGGLAGELGSGDLVAASTFSGTISLSNVALDPFVEGQPSEAAANYIDVGGAVGFNLGTIENVATQVAIDVSGDPAPSAPDVAPVTAGGLAGSNDGVVADSSAQGSIALTGKPRDSVPEPDPLADDTYFADDVGGAIGLNFDLGEVSGVAADVDITLSSGTNAFAGGLVGTNEGLVEASIAAGNVAYTDPAVFHEGSGFGGFVGENTGTILDARASGAVNFAGPSADGDEDGVNFVALGGFAGANSGLILRTVATGATSGDGGSQQDFSVFAGGHTGDNAGTVGDSYATGAVSLSNTAQGAAGGFVGRDISSTTVSDSYSTGTVTAPGSGPDIGGFAGQVLGGGVSGSFWDVSTSGLTTSAGGTGLTTGEFQDTATFLGLAGWDFGTTWAPGTPGGSGVPPLYPQLYTVDPVVFALIGDFPGGVEYGQTLADATGTTAGGPDAYVFGPLGETLPDSLIFSGIELPLLGAGLNPGILPGPRQVSGDLGTTFDVIYGPVDVDVAPRPLEVTALDQSKLYGDPDFTLDALAFEISLGDLVAGDSLDGVTLSSLGEPVTAGVGDYAIEITGTNGTGLDNYEIAVVDGTLTVTPRPLTITAEDQVKNFADDAFDLGQTAFTTDGLVNDDGVSSVALASPGATPGADTGTYAITPSDAQGSGLGNYTISYEAGVLTVTAADLTILIGDQSKTYGDPDFQLDQGAFTAQGLRPGDTVTGLVLTSDGEPVSAPVGDYSITVADPMGIDLGNYTIEIVDGQLTVTPAPLTITASDQTAEYRDPDFALDQGAFTVDGLRNDDTVDAVALDAPALAGDFPDVGQTPILIADPEGTGLDNYTVTLSNGTLTITPAPLSVVIDDRTKVYGDPDFELNPDVGPEGLATIEGLRGPDSVDSLTLASDGAPVTSPVDSYAITLAEITGSGLGNYEVNETPGTLTVTPAPLSILIGDREKVYGDPDFVLDPSGDLATVEGLREFDQADLAFASEGEPPSAPVDIYDIALADGVAAGLSNYDVSVTTGQLSVTPAPLTLSIADRQKVYGDPDFVLNSGEAGLFSFEGLRNEDSIEDVPLESDGAPVAAGVGDYAITPGAIESGVLENYVLSVEPGELSVTPAPLTITATDRSKEYGDPGFALGTSAFTVEQLRVDDTVDSVTLSSDGAPDAAGVGSYDILPSAAQGTGLANYDISYVEGTLTVTPRDLAVQATDQTKIYGDPDFVLDQTAFLALGLRAGDAVSVTLSSPGAPPPAPVGDYTISISAEVAGDAAANYVLSTEGATLEVQPAPLTITPDDRSKIEGETLVFQGTEFSVAGLRNDDAVDRVDLTSPGAPATAPASGSPFPIEVVDGSERGRGLGNYVVDYGTGTLTVEPERVIRPERPPFVVVPPPNPIDNVPTEIITNVVQSGGGGGGLAFGTGSAQVATGSLQVAETTLAIITRASDELTATAAACRQSESQVTDFLACISEALESYAAALDPAVLELPEAMETVSASIEVARQGIESARRRAEQRLEGVTDPAARREIERQALDEARGALQTAEAEVTKALTLIRADDPELANAYRAQADTVLAAIDAVDLELQRAVGL